MISKRDFEFDFKQSQIYAMVSNYRNPNCRNPIIGYNPNANANGYNPNPNPNWITLTLTLTLTLISITLTLII